MLEGPAEQAILKAGQWLADQFAYRRVSKKFSKFARDYIRNGDLTRNQVRLATRSALKEALLVRKSPHAFSSLRFFALRRSEPLADFVDAQEYWRTFHRLWGGPTRAVTDAKTLTRKLLGTAAIPDIGYFVGGRWFDKDWQITSLDVLVSRLPASQEVVLKADFSERGNAVEIMPASELLNPNRIMTANSVLQRKIEQHTFFSELSGGKGCTIRITTVFWPSESKPQLVAALVKWDVVGDQETSRVNLDVKTGAVVPPIFGPSWTRLALPDRLLSGRELVVPGFEAAIELVLELHSKSPHYQLIGWDLIVDAEQNPWIFEWNADHPAIFNLQSQNGPVLKEGAVTQVSGRRRR